MNEDIRILTAMVRGVYDLQMLRMQAGLRLVANFRAKLKDDPEDEEDTEDGELSKRAKKLIDLLRGSYTKLMEGVARNRTLPKEEGFTGDELIGSHAELVLADNFFSLEKEEKKQFARLEAHLDKIPIWTHWLRDQVGIGPAMGGVLVTYLDPHKARNASSFWMFAGLDVAPDGFGRSRRKEHLVERTYTDKNGDEATRVGLTYQPFLKARLMGVVAGSFLRLGSPWRETYDQYKHRLETDPSREKVTVAMWKKRRKAGEDVTRLWTPGRIDMASKRYMVKCFLAELWVRWRGLEGLPVTDPYAVAMQGRRPHNAERRPQATRNPDQPSAPV